MAHLSGRRTVGGELDGSPTPDLVTSRAEGRPPSEASSDDPHEQAQVVLEESEARIAARAAEATGADEAAEATGADEAAEAAESDGGAHTEVRLCGATVVRRDGVEGACTLVEGHAGEHMGIPAPLSPEEE